MFSAISIRFANFSFNLKNLRIAHHYLSTHRVRYVPVGITCVPFILLRGVRKMAMFRKYGIEDLKNYFSVLLWGLILGLISHVLDFSFINYYSIINAVIVSMMYGVLYFEIELNKRLLKALSSQTQHAKFAKNLRISLLEGTVFLAIGIIAVLFNGLNNSVIVVIAGISLSGMIMICYELYQSAHRLHVQILWSN